MTPEARQVAVNGLRAVLAGEEPYRPNRAERRASQLNLQRIQRRIDRETRRRVEADQ